MFTCTLRLSQHYSCLFYMSACAAYLIATTQAHFVLPRFTTFCIPLQPWPLHLLQMLRWEMRLRLTGRLHLRWWSLLTLVTRNSTPSDLQRVQLPLQSLHAWQHGLLLTTTRQLSWINYTSRSTRQPLLHHCLTTLPTLSFSLHLHWKSINYSHNNKQLHFHTDTPLQFHTAQRFTT